MNLDSMWIDKMRSFHLEVVMRSLHMKAVLDGIAREWGLNRAFKKLYNLQTFSKTIYLKFKTWIAEAIILVYKLV